MLAALGEGPLVVGDGGGRSRVCPIGGVVPPWRRAVAARDAFLRAGVELERVGAYLARADELGETVALLPHQRAQAVAALSELTLAKADLRELVATWEVAVGRELAYVRCTPALLEAAAADPRRYPATLSPTAPSAPPPRPPPAPTRRGTFYVDNRGCTEPLTVFVDGEAIGEAPADERRALSAPVGRRALCLLTPGRAVCGDRGTVRQVYLHDGWEVVMRCPAS
ncbi:MAG: hypothetical protein R2939_11335 [Kofleriaceae bacterium]